MTSVFQPESDLNPTEPDTDEQARLDQIAGEYPAVEHDEGERPTGDATETTTRAFPPPPPSSMVVRGLPTEPPRRKRRFAAGLVTGAVATGLVATGIVLALDYGDGSNDRAALTPVYVNLHELVVRARPSIVAIHTTITRTDTRGQEFEGEASGTGWVVSADGFIATNAHVVDEAETIRVTLDDGSSEVAVVIASDPRADLAVLRIDRDDLTPLPIGDSETMNVGDPVVAIGNALDLGAEPTVTDGIVSAKDRTIVEPNGQTLVDLIQTSAAINLGNSGGPLLNLRGEVVGVNTAVSGQGQNIGFAISITAAEGLIEQLQDGNVPRHALLGVTTSNVPPDVTEGPTAGAVIESIAPDTAAADSELQEGDIIVAVGGESISGPVELAAAIARLQPEESVAVTYSRGGKSTTIDITLGFHPDE